jgi:hypothetical protein
LGRWTSAGRDGGVWSTGYEWALLALITLGTGVLRLIAIGRVETRRAASLPTR